MCRAPHLRRVLLRLELLGEVLRLVRQPCRRRRRLLRLRWGSQVTGGGRLGVCERVGVLPGSAALEEAQGGFAGSVEEALELRLLRLLGPAVGEGLALVVVVAAVELEDFFGGWVRGEYRRRAWT